MVGTARPLFVLFGSSIVQLSFSNGGWGAILSDIYSRKVCQFPQPFSCNLGIKLAMSFSSVRYFEKIRLYTNYMTCLFHFR